MNELCKIKGHMWYTSKRKILKKDTVSWSIPSERKCARCGEAEDLV